MMMECDREKISNRGTSFEFVLYEFGGEFACFEIVISTITIVRLTIFAFFTSIACSTTFILFVHAFITINQSIR